MTTRPRPPNVPRGTSDKNLHAAPLLFRANMRMANLAGSKDTTRRILTAANSVLSYGQFEGLDLEGARAVRDYGPPHLAAPCTYPRTQFRAGMQEETQQRIVKVRPKVQAGALFWDKTGRFGSRAASTMSFEVLKVDVGRVQDMTDSEALREGVEHVVVPIRAIPVHALTPRGVFAWLWDSINGAGSWAQNPWVWIYRYRVIHQNINDLLAERTKLAGGVRQ